MNNELKVYKSKGPAGYRYSYYYHENYIWEPIKYLEYIEPTEITKEYFI